VGGYKVTRPVLLDQTSCPGFRIGFRVGGVEGGLAVRRRLVGSGSPSLYATSSYFNKRTSEAASRTPSDR